MRARAEHLAIPPLGNPKGGDDGAFSTGDHNINPCTGIGRFRFTREAHCELVFENDEDLRAAVSKLLEGANEYKRKVSQPRLARYVADRLNERDPEWQGVFDDPNKGGDWLNLARTAD